jgi:VanZ family protein
MRRLAQAIGWALLFAIAVVSFVPPQLRPETTLPHDLEHAAIFFLAGFAFGLGYQDRLMPWLFGLSAFALAIEIIQLGIPGRHARASDFVVDAVAIATGLFMGVTLDRFTRRE